MDINSVNGEVKAEFDAFKKMDKQSFFCFDKLYFPAFARNLFIVMCIFVVVAGVLAVFAGIFSMFSMGFFTGIAAILGSVISTFMMIIILRFWFEVILVVFNIHDAVQDIRENIKK